MVFPVMYVNEVSLVSHQYVLPVKAWEPSIMMSTIVAMHHLRCEKGEKIILKNSSSENLFMCLYEDIYVKDLKITKKFPFSRTDVG